jgi:hypothetical protein
MVIPPIDPNSQLPFAGNRMSVVSEPDLLHLVSIAVLPPKELCSWWICHGVTVPTEDTHESVIYVPFLLRGIALPISPFFRGLLDFYRLNLTHLNPNSILQISIYVHLCEAFLGVLPHFGLRKYLYHCRPGMAGGQHQLVGGASLEMRHGRKTDYLEIPLKDSIKGWRLEWFIVENHGKSLPPRSGRQPDVRTPSWTESPTDQKVAEAGALLAEVGLLKERGLTAEAVVADFVFKNIQTLKDRAYPAYLYRGLADSTRVTNRRILAVDLVNRLEMILRGKVSNVGAPIAYSAWNLPPSKAFTHFVSNPPIADGGLGLRVRPSAEEVSALVASIGEIPDDERQVHFEVRLDPNDAEISAMLDMLAEDSSDAATAGTLAVVPLPEAGTTLDVQRPVSVRSKRPCRANQPDSPADEQKKKRRHFRRVCSLDREVGPSVPVAEEVPVPEFTDADPNGCDPSVAEPNGCAPSVADPNGCAPSVADPNGGAVCVADKIAGEEEDEVPLTQKNSRQYIASGESSGVPSPALSALIGLQELSLANFDQTLEDMVPEDLLSEPADGDTMDVCADVFDAGLGSSQAASHASSTLERGLEGQETDFDRLTLVEVTEGPSALEAAAAENLTLRDGVDAYPDPEGVAGDDSARLGSVSHDPAPEGVAGDDPAQVGSVSYDPAPEGVRAGSPSCTSMDVHVGSPPHSGCMVVAQVSGQGVALEASVPDDQALGSADDTELVPAGSLQVAPDGDSMPSHQLISHDLGVPSFFSNLQVLCHVLV